MNMARVAGRIRTWMSLRHAAASMNRLDGAMGGSMAEYHHE
jgi:hypothetical protein